MAVVKVRDDMACIREKAMNMIQSGLILIYSVAVKFGNISNFILCIY